MIIPVSKLKDRVRCNMCGETVVVDFDSDTCPECGFNGGLMDFEGQHDNEDYHGHDLEQFKPEQELKFD